MFNPRPNTAELESTLVKLDTLYSSFNTLLESAQEQLAALSLEEHDYQRLLKTAVTNKDFNEALVDQTSFVVLDIIRKDENNTIAQTIVAQVSKQVLADYDTVFQAGLKEIYSDVLNSQVFQDAIDARIAEHTQVQESFTISEGLKALISKATSTDETQQRTT
jgi:hypothetical protein